jgi:hypothetical protein
MTYTEGLKNLWNTICCWKCYKITVFLNSQDYCLSGFGVVCESKNFAPFRREVLLRSLNLKDSRYSSNQRVCGLLFFKHEVGGGRFFKEFGKYIPDYTASYPGRQRFCGHPLWVSYLAIGNWDFHNLPSSDRFLLVSAAVIHTSLRYCATSTFRETDCDQLRMSHHVTYLCCHRSHRP